ncbi:MAG: hypothetical protein KJO69_01760 [Gammaproteobacteria bacterium]|nr:hypothetical protein [Gammaproteobacteria bacterium]
MSTAEAEVAEAITETEQPAEQPEVEEQGGIDIQSASDSIAKDLFGAEPEKTEEVEEIEEVDEPEKSEEPEKVEETEEVKEVKAAPQSWKKEMRESWEKLEPEVQDYIELREEQMREGVEVRKEDADLGMKLRDALAPYETILKKQNIDPVTASQRMMSAHMRLATAPLEERKQLFAQLAKSYGITDEPVDEETQNLMKNPFVQNLINKVNRLEQNVSASQYESQQERETRINEEVKVFASEHPYFDDLSDDIAKLIRADYSLEDAYNMAFKNSQYFEKNLEKEREKELAEKEKAKKQEAEKAKKAKSVNVRGRDTKKAPTAPKGTMEDTMREVMREIKNRN